MNRLCLVFFIVLPFEEVYCKFAHSKNNKTDCKDDPPLEIDPKDCCKIPQLINIKSKKGNCDLHSLEENGLPSCKQHNCLFKVNKLMRKGRVDRVALRRFVDKWSTRNRSFKKGAQESIRRCINKDIPIDDQVCDASKYVYCITATLFEYCPVWNTEIYECETLKTYMNDCSKKSSKYSFRTVVKD